MARSVHILGVAFFLLVLVPFDSVFAQGKPYSAEAALLDNINKAYREVYGKNPTVSAWTYWAGRVQRGEKKTYAALVGAMGYQKANPSSAGGSVIKVSTLPAAGGFKIDKKFYPSTHNPNFLPEGTLVKSPSHANVYYIRGGKKSWVLPAILNTWWRENHFFGSNMVVTISDTDLARYPTASSVNKLYIGKVLQHPDGTQYYIDDKLRKRKLSAGVRGALKFPKGNLYKASAVHLREFKAGPALTRTDVYPGGMVFYDGPFHGGRIWKTKEAAGGTSTKHLYLKDRFYEADGYPDESQRAPVSAGMLAKHGRGANIDRYPDGWLVGVGSNIYVMQQGKLRLITSLEVFNAMGYRDSQVHREYPELYRKYAQGQPIRAFKSVVSGAAASKGSPKSAPSTASNLIKVRPEIRSLISELNTLYITIFDKEPTAAENKFWVGYLYNGEVNNRTALVAAMRKAATTGKKPALTSRTAVISSDSLKLHWFPYLFYFVHQGEPSEADREYWYSRIKTGDRDSIEKLGGTIQWLKNTSGATRR